MLFSNKMEQTTNTCNKMDESQVHYARWKKPDPKDYLLSDSIYITFWKWQNYKDRNQIRVYQGMGYKEGSLEKGRRAPLGWQKCFNHICHGILKKNEYFPGVCLVGQLSCHLGCPHPISECLGSNPGSTLIPSFLLMQTLEGSSGSWVPAI